MYKWDHTLKWWVNFIGHSVEIVEACIMIKQIINFRIFFSSDSTSMCTNLVDLLWTEKEISTLWKITKWAEQGWWHKRLNHKFQLCKNNRDILNDFSGVPHAAISDTTFRGYDVPKGTILIANHYAILFDPKVFVDPEEFNPCRYLDEDGSLIKGLVDRASSQFGIGGFWMWRWCRWWWR